MYKSPNYLSYKNFELDFHDKNFNDLNFDECNIDILNKTEKHVVYGVSLSGLKKEDLIVEIKQDGYLFVYGTTTTTYEDNGYKKDISYSKMIKVDKTITENDIKGKYENGYLTLTIPHIGSNVKQNRIVIVN